MLSQKQRLRKTSDFKAVYSRGRSYVHPMLVVYVLKQPGETARIGFSVSKKLGGAVVPNPIQRLLREATRTPVQRLAMGTAAVVVARSAIAESTLGEIETVLEAQFRRAGAFADPLVLE